jgi:hypothetical protein
MEDMRADIKYVLVTRATILSAFDFLAAIQHLFLQSHT